MAEPEWHDVGEIETLRARSLQQIVLGRTKIALSCVDGVFAAISGVCNHAGGPLGDGRLDGDYVVCPWHNWKFHRSGGQGEPGFEGDLVPRYDLREEGGHLFVDVASATRRHKTPHPKHALERSLERAPGPVRVVGISTTNMDVGNPRYSTSEVLLETALGHARDQLGAETRLVKLRELQVRACEGYYSKSAHACTWPCSITQMDPSDQMDQVYEAMVFWGDVIVVATPIRWGVASSLYFKMAERLNCVQNQITIRHKVLLRNKVASFIITGGQDNVQGVAGQALTFFSEIGFQFPQFPYIAHSRGWSAEDMEQNVDYVRTSQELHDGARALVTRAVDKAKFLLGPDAGGDGQRMPPGGRKASGITRLRVVSGETDES